MKTTRRDLTLDELKGAIKWYLNTNDELLVDNYTALFLKLARDFDEGISHIRPTIVCPINSKTYYGKELMIKDYKIYIDGKEVEGENINYSGILVIDNSLSLNESRKIQIHGDLVSDKPITTHKLFCDNLQATVVNVTEKLSADDITAEKINTGETSCSNIKCNDLSVGNDIHANDISVGNNFISQGNVKCQKFNVLGNNNAKIIEVEKKS
ncbi:MAG: hypothetical protein US50_C0012G0014 [Candidatus Nomurabacteria bacterium GW2011_GWB1_37_5]|uniref:Uncharacterized protein n=1 Tax=Candidatus Nomurabacteria bacterium GW2011_GWB1_37_5 TaxID=1618742 RepID=A0A0G0JFL8_9BACT|nr:MAG: hypothetical protein US50_C0012G0014 [Candidatus Nomurabacteria bacterium GW2011_GWB1_37_5]